MEMLIEIKNHASKLYLDIASSGYYIEIILAGSAAIFIGLLLFLRRRKPVMEDTQTSKLSLPPGPTSSFILAGFDFGMHANLTC